MQTFVKRFHHKIKALYVDQKCMGGWVGGGGQCSIMLSFVYDACSLYLNG